MIKQALIIVALVATAWARQLELSDVLKLLDWKGLDININGSTDTGIPYDGLRVKFGWSEAMADETHFFTIPRMMKEAEAMGWKRFKQAAPEMPELRMYCPPEKAVCALYDPAGGFVAGLQLALLKSAFDRGVFFNPDKNMVSWTPKDPDEPDVKKEYWTAAQYFVSKESLKAGVGPTSGNGETLQDGGIWVRGPDSRLMRIPTVLMELESTPFKQQNCVPLMGTHYYYNMTPALRCDRIEPWFVLVHGATGDVIGTGFQVFGRLTNQPGEREWWENVHAPKLSAQITIPLGPRCIYDYAEASGVVSLHIYYINSPWEVLRCKDGDSIKQAPFMDRLYLNSWRYATAISNWYKEMSSVF